MSTSLVDPKGNEVTRERQKKAPELSKEKINQIQEQVRETLFSLYLKFPFFAMLIERFQIVVTRDLPTAAVHPDGRLFVNPEFWLDKINKYQRRFLMAHETLHPAFRHHIRRGGRQARLWNVAADYVINYMLVEEMGRKALIEGGCYSEDTDPDHTAEDVYEMLLEKQAQQQGGGSGTAKGGGSARGKKLAENNPDFFDDLGVPDDYEGDILDDWEDGPGGQTIREREEETPTDEEGWNTAVAQAATRAKMQGKMSALAEMAVQDLLEPKLHWTEQLVGKLSMIACKEHKNDYTWTNPDKRFVGEDIFLPSTVGYRSKVAFAVDTSGSMHGNWLQACSEIEQIRKTHNVEVYLMWADYDVEPEGWLSPYEAFPKHAFGGGGTSFVPPFDHLKETGIDKEISHLIYLTDLWGNFPEEPDEFKTIWVSFSDETPPWGEHIIMPE